MTLWSVFQYPVTFDKWQNYIEENSARYVKGIYTYNASVTGMLNELLWESLESHREQSRLIMMYNILKQNIYFPSE